MNLRNLQNCHFFFWVNYLISSNFYFLNHLFCKISSFVKKTWKKNCQKLGKFVLHATYFFLLYLVDFSLNFVILLFLQFFSFYITGDFFTVFLSEALVVLISSLNSLHFSKSMSDFLSYLWLISNFCFHYIYIYI